MWQLLRDRWHMTHSFGWTFSQKFSSLALLVWNWQCLEYIWIKRLFTQLFNDGGDCRTAPATPGVVKKKRQSTINSINSSGLYELGSGINYICQNKKRTLMASSYFWYKLIFWILLFRSDKPWIWCMSHNGEYRTSFSPLLNNNVSISVLE